jgi:hypothetical protein
MKKNTLLIVVAVLFCSCMSANSRLNYMRRYLNNAAVSFNLKADFLPKNQPIPDSVRRKVASLKWKELRRGLDSSVAEMAIMPDSFRTVKRQLTEDDKERGITASDGIDIKTWYILNKNKIKFLKEHHITRPNVIIVDK